HLMNIQERISLKRNQELVGTEIMVLVDREEEEFWAGRSEADSPEVDQEVLIRKTSTPIHVGSFNKVRITEASHFDLLGEISR
ncbi:MAG: TRAM domain-containing protein, partial [Bacteroidota bacterium]|nr:TRAM domain-containing protein [Bacteroidota bacterium]